MISFLKLATASFLLLHPALATQDGEEARWLVQSSQWGTLSWLEGEGVSNMATSIGEEDGRIFFYLMPEADNFQATLTLSEAALDPSQFEGARCGPDGDLDPEDPRCAKLSISGNLKSCEGDDADFGMQALLKNHPVMSEWPPEHGFKVFEMEITRLWMIANFGGGGYMEPQDYLEAEPKHHPASFPTRRNLNTKRKMHEEENKEEKKQPEFGEDAVSHARWLVSKSLWTTVSSKSSKFEGNAFGNIRSIADGACMMRSTGLPVFYLPSPDPTAIDVEADNQIAITFTEAALAETVVDGKPCGGMDAEDPTCAKISLTGHAEPLEDEDQINAAMEAFAASHPRARWLSQGGAHTGGKYYTLQLHKIEFLRTYGGFADVSVDDYLSWKPEGSMFESEEDCAPMNGSSQEQGSSHGYGGEHGGMGGHEGGYGGEHGSYGGDHGSYGEYGSYEEHGSYGEYGNYEEHGSYGGEQGSYGGEHDSYGGDHGSYKGEHGSYGGEKGIYGGEHGSDKGEHDSYGGENGGMGGSEPQQSYTQQPQLPTGFSSTSFAWGMALGLIIWGPTLALIVYNKECNGGICCRKKQYDPSPIQDKSSPIV